MLGPRMSNCLCEPSASLLVRSWCAAQLPGEWDASKEPEGETHLVETWRPPGSHHRRRGLRSLSLPLLPIPKAPGPPARTA